MKKPSQIEKSLREIYELGKEHGYKQAVRDMEIERLKKVIEDSSK